MRDVEFGMKREEQQIDYSASRPLQSALPLPGTLTVPDALLIPLVSTLEEMILVQQEMLSLLQREKKLMIGGELDDLLRCLQEKENFLGRLRGLEQRRQAEIAPMARQWGGEDRPLTLKQLAQRVPEPFRGRLTDCHTRLEALTASIQELNQINGLLIDRIQERITALVGLLRHLSSTDPIYQPNGALQPFPSGGRAISQG
ncbi:flagella synthesis protein FlgN [Candidatus Manganitrophus noduliformans]|nr:flagellar protein FlgN [Candidatus Manganitrophus noduliformans]